MNKRKFLKNSLLGALTALATVAFAAMSVTTAIAGDLEVVGDESVEDGITKGFAVTFDASGEKTIAFAGPLEVFARCSVSGAFARITIFVTSSVAGWFNTRFNGPRGAGQRDEISSNAATRPFYTDELDQFSATGPDNDGTLFYISIDGDDRGLGLNVFNNRCIVNGDVTVRRSAILLMVDRAGPGGKTIGPKAATGPRSGRS